VLSLGLIYLNKGQRVLGTGGRKEDLEEWNIGKRKNEIIEEWNIGMLECWKIRGIREEGRVGFLNEC